MGVAVAFVVGASVAFASDKKIKHWIINLYFWKDNIKRSKVEVEPGCDYLN